MLDYRYDKRLDSPDEATRLRAEVDALTTALMGANSRHADEYASMHRELECARASHDMQVRNTLEFQKEANHCRALLGERDAFITARGLWDEYVAAHPEKPST